jgi:hypothetical protein
MPTIELDMVTKRFTSGGVNLYNGEVVATAGWLHTRKLRDLRFLSPYNGQPVKCKLCGRMFISKDILDYHVNADHPEAEDKEGVA